MVRKIAGSTLTQNAPIRVRSARLDKPYEDMDEPPTEGQVTTSFSFDTLFEGYEGGNVFIQESKTRVEDYKNMLDADGKASSVEKLLTYPIIAAPWEIKGVAGDKGEADFIREFFDASYENGGMKTHIDQIIAQMNFAQTVSRCYFEKVPMVRESDGAHVYEKLSWCPQETCQLVLNARSSEIIGFEQEPVLQYDEQMRVVQKVNKRGMVPVLGQRAFVYIHGRWRDPIDGHSAMTVPYWCWDTKRKIRFLWYQFLETTSLPKTIVRNNDEEQARADAKKVRTLRSRDVLALGMETEVEAYESAGHGATQFIEAMRWLDSEMSNSVLGGFMDLTSSAASGKGSYALSADQSTLFLRTRRVVARDMARQITQHVIAPLIRWNFGRDAKVPQFVFGPLSEANEEKVMEMFGQVVTATQASTLPQEFFEQLAIRVANITELDPTRIQAAFDMIKEKNDGDDTKLVAGAVALATQLVEKKQADAQVEATKAQAAATKAAAAAPTPVMNDPNVPPAPKGGANGSTSRPVRRPVAGKKP